MRFAQRVGCASRNGRTEGEDGIRFAKGIRIRFAKRKWDGDALRAKGWGGASRQGGKREGASQVITTTVTFF